ncbi:MAG: hypothetical protein IJ295_01630, partial [Clostridia bacterium]|nr:hypothetical protein [Clostridia bacterium]
AAKHIKAGLSTEDAKAKAFEDLTELSQNGSDLNAEYARLGGDRAVITGLSAQRKEFEALGINIDFESNSAKAEMEKYKAELRDKTGSVEHAKELLDAAEEGRKNSIQNIAGEMAKRMGKSDDDTINNIKNILSKADASTSFDDIKNKLSSSIKGVSADTIEKSLEANYSKFTKEVQYNQEITELQHALAAHKSYDKGIEMFNGKIGDALPEDVKAQIVQQMRNVYDVNLYSTNEDSLGFQMNQIIKQYSDGLDNAECKSKVDALKKKMTEEFSAHYESVIKQYGNAIREFNTAKKYREEMDAVYTMSMIGEVQHQREFHIEMNMDPTSNQLLINDSLLQKMHSNGDYAGAGVLMQQLIDGIKRHDYDTVNKLGFDAETVNKLKQWEQSGDYKRLDGIAGLGAFDAAHMGSLTDKMGGNSLSAVKAALAQLTRVAESKTRIERFRIAEQDAAQNETRCRADVKQVSEQIDLAFRGKEFDNLIGLIKDSNGKVAGDASSMRAALRDMLDAVGNGLSKNDDKVTEMIDQLIHLRDDNLDNPAITNVLDSYINAISRAEEANYHAERTLLLRDQISDLDSAIREILPKIKDFSGGK